MSNYCEICDWKFVDKYALDRHLMGKKHTKKVKIEEERRKKEQSSIFISPIPDWVKPDDILQFFMKIEKIQYHCFGNRFCIIEFTSEKPVNYLLTQPIWMGEWLMNIRKRKLNNFNTRVQKKGHQLTPSENSGEETAEFEDENSILCSLNEETTFDGQLDRFLSLIQLDDSTVTARCDNVCNSLTRVLKIVFPNCKVIRFGSIVTGLHFKKSDIDIFLDIGEPVVDDDDLNSETLNSKSPWTPKLIFKAVKNVLFKNTNIFTQISLIPMAKIPIIKFNHIPTKTDCDISFKQSFGVSNSLLIKFLLTLDARVKPLMMIIKYWAKRLDITKTGNMTNYSLFMIIIFYLQQPNLQILPTINEIKSNCEPIVVDGWQINFNKDYKKNVTNNSSLPELVHGFFKFYAEISFYTTIINVLDGLLLKRSDSSKIASLGINIESLQLNKPACVLDPITFNRNIANRWSYRLLQNFQTYCNKCVQICEESAKTQYTNLLSALYDSNIKERLNKNPIVHWAILAGKFIEIGVSANFEKDIITKDKTKESEEHWFQLTVKIVKTIFERVFKFEVVVFYGNTSLKLMKTDKQSDVYSKKNDQVILLCKGKYCLNYGRKNSSTNLDVILSPIDKEATISDKVLEILQKKKPTPVKFTCILEKKLNPLRAELQLINECEINKAFTNISTFMKKKIPELVNKEFLHIAQYKREVNL